jgi:cellulose synthase/poly-beta-1,6-N-acetylglucosamine synthase-like glycosyltransferase
MLLLLLSVFRKQAVKRGDITPSISLIVSAHNEEKVIEQKILNSLSLDYPKDLLQIIIVSDGSTDQTNLIVSRYSSNGVKLSYYPERSGKTACLNKEVPLAKGEIIVFSDANSNYSSGAISELVSHFANKSIGFVTGHTIYSSGKNSDVTQTIGLYSRLELITKKLESKIGSCVGADGAIFAIRKELYNPLKDSDINDLVIPLQIIRQGFNGVLEPNAFCVEEVAENPGKEFARQVRISVRTIRALAGNLELMNPIKYGLFSFELFSHKCSKLFVPFALLLLFFFNIILVSNGVFYLLSLIGTIWKKRGIPLKILSMPETFALVNLAILSGWLKTLKGEKYTVWTTIRSA